MLWSSRVGKLQVRDRVLGSLQFRGDEKVLDVGCGRGLFLIGAVRRLTSGRGTGVDIWSTEDLSSNSADAARANAKAEGVADRIRIEDADARKLPFASESFDVVLSSLTIHNIEERDERSEAIAEMVRVLRPGGRLALFDIRHTAEYARQLQQLGLADVSLSPLSFLWCQPARSLTARKP
jgi:ubiquinone/menaquinone biosynthesis C-methylase UbiE